MPRTAATPDPTSELAPALRRLLFGAIVVVGFALRAYYVVQIWPHPAARLPILDAEAYRKIALGIRAGDWLGDSVYYLDPLYPFVLAAIYSVVPPDTRGVLLVQSALDSVTILFVLLIARRAFGDRAALAAGALAATYKLFFYYDGLLQKEALMLFLLTGGLLLVLRADEREGAGAWLPAGVVLGLGALTRGNALLFAPVLVAWLGWKGRGTRTRRAAAALAFAAGLALAILPVTLRNYAVGRDLVLLNSQLGQNFYIGHARANRTGAYLAPSFLRANPEVEEEDFAAEAKRRTNRSDLRPSEISSFWLREGLREIAADPGGFLRHSGKKLLVFANAYEIPDNSSFEYFQKNVSPLLRAWLPTWAFVLPLALAGMWTGRRRRGAVPLLLFFASYGAGLILFFNLSRMRLPVVPVALVFAGHAIVDSFDRVRRRDWRALAVPALIASVAVPITQIDLPRQPLNVRHFNLGTAFLRRSESEWAVGLALRERGEAEGARAAFARSFDARGDAEAEFLRGLQQYPDYDRLRSALRNSLLMRYVALESLEMTGPALEAAQRLTATFDRFPMGYVALGRAYAKAGEPDLAKAAFEHALRLDSESRDARAGLEALTLGPRLERPSANDYRATPPRERATREMPRGGGASTNGRAPVDQTSDQKTDERKRP